MLEQLTEMWESGFRVFPLYETRGGKCACGDPECGAVGKHPVLSGWQTCPAWSQEQFDNMVEYGQFTTGYGVVCRDLIVIDIDPRNGGADSWEQLVEAIPEAASAGMIVETGRRDGGRHLYFKAPEGVALLQHLPQYKGIDFRSGMTYVVGAGSMHAVGNQYRVVYGSPDEIEVAPESLINALKRPERYRNEYNGTTLDVSVADVADMLKHCDPNSGREEWLRIGMAVHHATNGSGFSVWDDWSALGSTYPGSDDLAKQWHHFGKSGNPVTIGTLIYYAQLGGWVSSVTFDEVPETFVAESKYPCPIDGIDLRKPPGFVGEVTEWFASLPRRRRDNLAVMAALTTVGNHIGLRMIDERDGVTANLITFGVAGSGTGKESQQQGFSEIHRETGMSAAVHGSIKSDAEIYRNLTRHQAALYNVDEISDFLEKINNSKKRGGASYLDSVIATVMSVFTKANGYLLLTGDAKEDLKSSLLREASQEEKKLDDGRGSEERIEQIMRQVSEIDMGLKNPFLSMCGYGTPDKFTALMDYRSATEGFFGRALVFVEKNNAPKVRKGYVKPKLPDSIKFALINMYHGGEFDASRRRVEHDGARVKIPTDDRASELLDHIVEWMDEKAIEHQGTTGLEPLYLRGYELASKVSFILAAPHGLRTYEHVQWAFALVLHDLNEKAMLVTSNDRRMDAPDMALYSKVMTTLDAEEFMTIGVIRNKCRSYKPEDVEKMLKIMVDNGKVQAVETKHAKNGTVTTKYRRL